MSKYITKTPVRVPMVLPPSMVASINDTLGELDSINTNTSPFTSDEEIKYKKTYHQYDEDEEAIMPKALITFGFSIKMDSTMFAGLFETRPQTKIDSHVATIQYEKQNTSKYKVKNNNFEV